MKHRRSGDAKNKAQNQKTEASAAVANANNQKKNSPPTQQMEYDPNNWNPPTKRIGSETSINPKRIR